jgi:hypothetical protein
MNSSKTVKCVKCKAPRPINSDEWVWADTEGNVWADPEHKVPWCVKCLPAQKHWEEDK